MTELHLKEPKLFKDKRNKDLVTRARSKLELEAYLGYCRINQFYKV